MGGQKKWLSTHVDFCFSRFTDNPDEEDKLCIVGTDVNGVHTLSVPNAARIGPDPVREWYEEARLVHADLWNTINLQCF
jgi:hypothetical protein